MMADLRIDHAVVVSDGTQQADCSVVIKDGLIAAVIPSTQAQPEARRCIDAQGMWLLPGVIDTHVHFRQPGMEHKATILSESRAAVAGGVTSYIEMPNTQPTTTTLEAWQWKQERAAQDSAANYAFFPGATNDNIDFVRSIDRNPHMPGLKVFMGSSTGGMLLENRETLMTMFRSVRKPIVTHCEDTTTILRNAKHYQSKLGTTDLPIHYHPLVRSRQACCASTQLAIELAQTTGARLHVAHLTTTEELSMVAHAGPQVSAEACVAHLLFSDADYATLGSLIKCNPAVKTLSDQEALRRGLTDGSILTVATDHAPHQLVEKQGGCLKATSGMPMVQFSLCMMLDLVDAGVLSIERLVALMCHHPALLFGIEARGFVRPGYKADLVLVTPREHLITAREVMSLCAWTPLEGRRTGWTVHMTLVGGCIAYDNGHIDQSVRGETLRFRS